MNRTLALAAGHLFFVLAVSPFLFGVIHKTKAWMTGRKGAPLWQPYLDIRKLLRKGAVYSRTTTWIFGTAPLISFAAILTGTMLIPIYGRTAPLSFQGDLILFAYLMGLSRFCTILAALDTGSAFEGMGASREATFACFAETAMFLAFISLGIKAGTFSLSGMLDIGLARVWEQSAPTVGLSVAAFIVVLLTENARIPVDDPCTHLELTMIHEVMVLDHGGPDFGVIQYAHTIKFFAYAALLARLIHPVGHLSVIAGMGMLLAELTLISVLIGLVESSMARLRMGRIPQLLISANILAGFSLILAMVLPR